MKHAQNSILDDALSLGLEILRTRNIYEDNARHVAMEHGNVYVPELVTSFEIEFTYANVETPHLLQQVGAFELHSIVRDNFVPLPHSLKHPILKGYFYIKVDFDVLGRWVDEQMKNKLSGVVGSEVVRYPLGKDYTYRDKVLYLKNSNGNSSVVSFVDAHVLRPVFESFYYLFEEGSNKFSVDTVVKKYTSITGKTMDKYTLADRIGSIRGTKIRNKTLLRERIVWKFLHKEDVYLFDILPMSSEG